MRICVLALSCSICERITPRLAHANAAVVLSAVKVLMKLMEMLPADSDFVTTLTKKLAPPLVTLLSSEPEASYWSSQIYMYWFHC
jgi:vesicle coat complex subunit